MLKALFLGLLAVVPSSTNYVLQSNEFGNGAGSSSSSNYQLQTSTGTPAGNLTGGSYALPAGIQASAAVATPSAPTFVNPDGSYNRLKLTLNTAGLPADAKYLIAISHDGFATMQYIQTDQTVGASASIGNYQSYAAWGGAGGFWVLGLDYDTTYIVKVAALQGPATGSPFGPTASTATVAPSVTFAVSTSLAGSPPFSANFSSLSPGAVMAADATLFADITTNALHGGSLLVQSQNGSLNSTHAASSITSATADMAAANTGYGAQVTNASQGSGGPLTAISPFNGSADNVGGLMSGWQSLADFPGPITAGSLTVTLKAKANAAVPAATDYTDRITVSAALYF